MMDFYIDIEKEEIENHLLEVQEGVAKMTHAMKSMANELLINKYGVVLWEAMNEVDKAYEIDSLIYEHLIKYERKDMKHGRNEHL